MKLNQFIIAVYRKVPEPDNQGPIRNWKLTFNLYFQRLSLLCNGYNMLCFYGKQTIEHKEIYGRYIGNGAMKIRNDKPYTVTESFGYKAERKQSMDTNSYVPHKYFYNTGSAVLTWNKNQPKGKVNYYDVQHHEYKRQTNTLVTHRCRSILQLLRCTWYWVMIFTKKYF